MKIFSEILPGYSFELLRSIQTNNSFKQFYLAGGTALSLQVGHRESIDLDFFTDQDFSTSLLTKFPKDYEVIRLHDNSIEVFSEKTKVMFFRFAFPLFNDLKNFGNITMAHPIDIGLMKLLALQGRTTRKDIIDLYFIDQEVIKLEELLDLFEKKYPQESFNSYDSLRQLFNIEQLEAQPMPKMFREVEWEECQKVVSEKVVRHIKMLLN